MEIDEVVRKVDSQQAKDVLKNLLTRYLNPAFGALLTCPQSKPE